MVYGHTPFSHFKDISRKILAIQNPLHIITFNDIACPLDARGEEMKDLAVVVGKELREDMRGCLRFEAKDRKGIVDLLRGEFLRGSMNPGASAVIKAGRVFILSFRRGPSTYLD